MKQPSLNRQAFTLIEMMVVVAILAILSTLLIVGISKLQTNAKRQQTTQLLENCRAMWAEYDSVNRLHIDPFVLGAPGNVTLDNETAVEQAAAGNAFADRIGNDVIITRSVFVLMRSQPNIRAGMDKFPSGRMFLTAQSTNAGVAVGAVASTYSAQTPYYPGDAASWTDPLTGYTHVYLCIHNSGGNKSGVVASPPDIGYWIPLNGMSGNSPLVDTTDPVLLDAWGNPIICCIGGELGGVDKNGNLIPLNADGSIPVGSGVLKVGGRSVIVNAPDKRMFWASAGPDGDFSRGDDNLYSFEK